MKILYIADGRSPIAINWINYFIKNGHVVHLVSTYPCQPISGVETFHVIPVGLSGIYGQAEVRRGQRGGLLRKVVPVGFRTRLRQWVAPLTLTPAVNSLLELIERIRPELVHAMRIPYEGIIASMAYNHLYQEGEKSNRFPLLISVWGNDFTLHAKSSRIMADHTRRALQTCDALHTDCKRDLKLADVLGFSNTKPSIILPGGGGIHSDIFYPMENASNKNVNPYLVDEQPLTLINSRGFRAYVRNDTFFRAIPMVIEKCPEVHFICPNMDGESQAKKWIAELAISRYVDLLPAQSQIGMAELFRQSQISISITTHDGTPNTLLEAMACGCFPIAGDIESLREWITPGMNGYLVDPNDPKALATAILNAIKQPELRRQARECNFKVVNEQYEYKKVMGAAELFYKSLITD